MVSFSQGETRSCAAGVARLKLQLASRSENLLPREARSCSRISEDKRLFLSTSWLNLVVRRIAAFV